MARVAGREAVKGFCAEKERLVKENFVRGFGCGDYVCCCSDGGGANGGNDRYQEIDSTHGEEGKGRRG